MNPVKKEILGFGFFLSLLIVKADPPPFDTGSAFGVNIHGGSVYAGDMKRIRDAGFRWVRTDLFWSNVERAKGVYNFKSFDALDRELRAQGLRALVVLDYGNSLYANHGDSALYVSRIAQDDFRRAYAAFSAAAVSHFAGRGYVWEQWNEPNNEHSWPPAPNSAQYIALMREACEAIRAKCPQEIIIGPAASGMDLGFVEACLKGGMLDYWSAVSVHPYRRNQPSEGARDYAKLAAIIAKYAAPGRRVPIICGEFGYSTAWKEINEFKQADYLTQMVQFSRQQGIPLTIWYDWRDDGDDPANQEDRFGLVRRASGGLFEPKPAYFAARRVLAGGVQDLK